MLDADKQADTGRNTSKPIRFENVATETEFTGPSTLLDVARDGFGKETHPTPGYSKVGALHVDTD